jgi:hypothetical protein
MNKIKTYKEATEIWKEFGLKLPQLPLDECIFYNAERLLKIKEKNLKEIKKVIIGD